jgi:hypothetical protein
MPRGVTGPLAAPCAVPGVGPEDPHDPKGIPGPGVSKFVSKNRVDGGGSQWTGEHWAPGQHG